ncbi:aminotransferase class I/II-fold pyridoxal phosphate-dependent enzyme [Cohnella caldifontis]|uniref:aminotransferase class I/II-fold pyridoxal phosphate-dependent enzyme n=1 Tax=Cohnella caldifontis TaxID=3027471 RepID=UPI0023ED0179|nr:aminotransferase class I/II-fold pyridoxal phosphate-dependent enzyme [Cohnella sp. YIM B05605]
MGTSGERAPIRDMLAAYAAKSVNAFHVPGHKRRAVWQDAEADARYRPLLEWDVTELADTDDLHHPAGPIAEAQRLAAECFGAEETRFLVGGSTAGNLAMILGTAAPGDLLIVQRNAHRSVFHGLMLAGVRAVLLPPSIDPESGLGVIPEKAAIAEAIARYPEAKGVVLSSPNYYGMAGQLGPIADICHSAGMPLLVDEAHGPHFGFHPSFPPSAMQRGADLAVQSAHKMLSAMTMGAMLHIQGKIVNREAVRQALRMVQSSSPSFPLLASLDLARRQLHTEGARAFEPALEAVRKVRSRLAETRYRTLGPLKEHSAGSGGIGYDPLKLVLYEAEGRMDGFQIRDELSARGCEAEMADSRYVVLAFGVGSRPEDGDALIGALRELSAVSERRGEQPVPRLPRGNDPGGSIGIPEPVQFGRSLGDDSERIPLERSVGRVAAEWVIPYPPGIPELYPGEKITEAILNRLAQWQTLGANIQGAEDLSLRSVRVFRSNRP